MGLLSISRQGRVYAKLEAVYGVAETIAAANAIRHQSITFPGDKFNRETVMEKQIGAGSNLTHRADRRETAGFTLEAVLRCGGAVNTVPELDPFLEGAFGAKTSVTLSTTVASGGTVGGATLASAGTLAVGDPVLITCPDGRKRVRWLASVAGAVVTWAPNLPTGQQPANAAPVKASIRYHQTTTLTKSLTIAHYLLKSDQTNGLARQVVGAGIDKFSIAFDANGEPIVNFNGDAKSQGTAQAKPGGFTTIGGLPPSGLVGETQIGNNPYPMLKAKIDIDNGLFWRKDEFGFPTATELLRSKRRAITLGLSAHVDDQTVLYDPTQAGSYVGLFLQTGFTEGNIIAVRAPNCEFKTPNTSDGDEVADWDYTGIAHETSDASNDSLALAIF